MQNPFPPHSSTVLIVDDDPAIRALIEAYLRRAGYQPVAASDGREALLRVMSEPPDAMILDLNMPNMDGFAVLRRMKARDLLSRVPTMILTAGGQAGGVMEAIQLGARDYLAKPFEEAMLLSRVARLLRATSPGTPRPAASSAR